MIPVPAILSGFRTQIAFMQVLSEPIKHDVRQQRRDYTALWHTFTGRQEEIDINMPGLDGFLQLAYKACVTAPAADDFHQQPVMYCIEIAGQVTFNHPAARVSPQSVSCSFTVRIAWWTLRSGRKPYESE